MDILEALRIAFFQMWLHVPYFILCCVPFLPKLRVRKRTLAAMFILTGLSIAAYYSLRETLFPALRAWNDLILLGFHVLYLLLYRRLADAPLTKLAYVMLLVDAYSLAINVVMKFVDVWLFPSHVSKMTATSYALLAIAVMAVTYPFVWRLLSGKIGRTLEKLPDQGFWRFVIPPAIFYGINYVYTNLLYGRMFRQTGKLDVQTFLIFLLVLAAEFVIYYFTLAAAQDMAERARAETALEAMEDQLAMQSQNYAQLTSSIEAARAARHDLRHHLSVMTAYIEKNDREGLKEYLEDYRKQLPEEGVAPICKNYAVEVVVKYYLQEACAAGAETDVKLDVPADVGIPDSDLTIVFGNLFENAAHGVARQQSGQRFLKARCMIQNGILVLTVDNSTDPVQKGRRKKNGKGLGQSSVAAVAAKYKGSARFSQEGHIYRASVMLTIAQKDT